MPRTLNNDSSQTFKAINYQYLIALEKCFEMRKGESIWIEKFGDVTSSNGVQIEVKDYRADLTDLDHNIWKTLKNWLDDKFEIEHYHRFILLTTQKISEKSEFLNWNSKSKEEKYHMLNEIPKNNDIKSKETKKLVGYVLQPQKKEKLLYILERFEIYSEYEKAEEIYQKLLETRTDGVIESQKENYIDALYGYIVKPEIINGGWKIKNEDFRAKTKSLMETMVETTRIMPKIDKPKVDVDTISEYQEYLFIQKIKEIEYEEVVSEAIEDFLYTRKMINEELRNYAIEKKEFKAYEERVWKIYKGKYRNASLDVQQTERIKESKKFYNEVTTEQAPNFYHYNDTNESYRNGILHEIANDEKNPKKLIWKLGEKDE